MKAQNHETFMAKISYIKDKTEQIQLMKTYWANFSSEEFIAYMTSNMSEIGIGIQSLLSSDSLSDTDKKNLNIAFDKGISSVKKMKSGVVATSI